jgi:hypothetical protein
MIVTEFPIGWYSYIAFWFVVWLALPPWKKDVKGSLMFGALGTVLGIGVEALAAVMGLWLYTGGNWPVILWAAYFVASMVWHQLYRLFESMRSGKFPRAAEAGPKPKEKLKE